MPAAHVFGARLGSKLVLSDAHLFGLVAYMAKNPVEAGLCARPEDWRFSSYRTLIGLEPGFVALNEILRLFSFDNDEARRRIAEYVCPSGIEP